jgi:hypothetical protein
VVIHPGRSIAATLKRYDWECPDTRATVTATRVLTVLSGADYENMGQEAFDLLVATGAGRSLVSGAGRSIGAEIERYVGP